MDDRLLALLNVAFVVALFVTAWLATGNELVPGVVAHDIGPCAVDRYRKQDVLVLACVGQDMFKVWPLPVVRPWWEDELHPEG